MHLRVLSCAVLLAYWAGGVITQGQTVLAIDFNARSADTPANTQPGFTSFTMTAASGVQATPSTRTFGNYTVTVATSGAVGYDDRSRGGPTDSGSFTESALLKDFIFSREPVGSGLDITVTGLDPDSNYRFTVWSYDASSSGNRVSDWTINDQPFTNGYAFNGSVTPVSNQQYQFSTVSTSDGSGQVVIRARRNAASVGPSGTQDFGVFINAFKIELPITVAPTIAGQPASTEVYAGGHAVFNVVSAGTAPLDFHWLRDGSVVQVTSIGRLVVSNAQPDQMGGYSVIVSNSSGTATSTVAQLTVNAVDSVGTALLAYWPFTDVTEVVSDFSGNGYDLWPTNVDVTHLVDRSSSPALSFDGSTQFLTRTNAPSDRLPAAAYPGYTVAMWVKGDGTAQLDRRVFAESSNTNNQSLLTIGTGNASTNAVNIYIRNNDGSVPINHRKTSLAAFDGAWHHIAWVDNNGFGTVFVDGVADTNDFNYTRGVLTPNIETIAAVYRTNLVALFSGSIDEVAVWGRALSEEDIIHVMNFGPLPPPTAGPELRNVQVTEATVTLTFTSATPAAAHTIEQATDLGTSPVQWTPVSTVTFTVNGDTVTAQFARPATTHAFFRVRQ